MIATVIGCAGLTVLASCQPDAGAVSETPQSASTASKSASLGFQSARTIKKSLSGKSIIPVNNGPAFYLDPNGTLHSIQAYHNPGPKNTVEHGGYSFAKAKNSTRAAATVGGVQVPAAPALCIPQAGLFDMKFPQEGVRNCLTMFVTGNGDIYAPLFDTFMVVSDGPGAFQSVVHNEGKLRDIPPPVPAYYGNIKKYGGIGALYLQSFPDDQEAQKLRTEFKLYLAQAKAQSDAQLKADLAAIEKKFADRAAKREQAKIAAARKQAAIDKKKADERRRAREAKCRAQTGKACTSSGGGLVGWMLTAGLNALTDDGGSTAPRSTSGSYTPKNKFTLVCRERLLLDVDTFKRGANTVCSGEVYQCEDQFKKQLDSRYGGLDKACAASFGSSYTYESIRNETAY